MKIQISDKNTHVSESVINEIKKATGFSDLTAKLLISRGVDTPEKAVRFINPGKKWFNDPFLLGGVFDAVNRIKTARDLGEKVMVFGDYDADGVCAATLLTFCLCDFGIEPITVVPERADGYGLNLENVLNSVKEHDIKLIITVDCGVSERENIYKIQSYGVDVIVTDHHEPPEELPECVLINPKIKGQNYPFDGLCGAGVAYKLGSALIGDAADEYLDIAALATVADSMDLISENRDIVYEGLKIFNSNAIRPCFKNLIGDANKKITSTTLAFNVAPKINAGGRMGDAKTALELLTCTDQNGIFDLSVKLNSYNVARQIECDEIYKQAKLKLSQEDLSSIEIITVCDEKWQTGFIGIVAARLVEEYNRPVIVFGGADGCFKGSARSVDGINVYGAVSAAGDLLDSFGGHSQAAGLTVKKENYEVLKNRLNKFIKDNYGGLSAEKIIVVDAETDGGIPFSVAKELEMLEPYGTGNKKPLFVCKAQSVKPVPLKVGSSHYSFKVGNFEVLDFNGEKNVMPLLSPAKKSLVYEPSLSVFRGREYLKGLLKYIIVDDLNAFYSDLYFFENELKKLAVDGKDPQEVLSIEELEKNGGRGVLYTVADVENLKYYDELKDLPINVFNVTEKKGKNVIVVSPCEIPDGYDKVVYLDEPLQFMKTDKQSYCNFELSGYEALSYLSTDRKDMIEAFNVISSYEGKEFLSGASAFFAYKPDVEMHCFVFAAQVFLELGFFIIENGILRRNVGVKSPLENSKIYGKVLDIRG